MKKCRGGRNTVAAVDFKPELHEKAAEEILERILNVYRPEEIIVHKHLFAEQYTDGERMYRFVRSHPTQNEKAEGLLKRMYGFLERKLQGCHVIEFPEHVLGDKNHKHGCHPLHYHALYYEYGSKALNIILEKHRDEKTLLDQLREQYSCRFRLLCLEIESKSRILELENRVSNLIQFHACARQGKEELLYDKLRSVTEMAEYLDMLQLLGDRLLILAAVRDTPGGKMPADILRKLQQLGFSKYPLKLWHMYNGMVYRGETICEKVSESAEQAVTSECHFWSMKIFLESESYRKGNVAKIELDGTDYAVNCRGINLVVYDIRKKEVVDSVGYDAHTVQSVFKRRSLPF